MKQAWKREKGGTINEEREWGRVMPSPNRVTFSSDDVRHGIDLISLQPHKSLILNKLHVAKTPERTLTSEFKIMIQ